MHFDLEHSLLRKRCRPRSASAALSNRPHTRSMTAVHRPHPPDEVIPIQTPEQIFKVPSHSSPRKLIRQRSITICESTKMQLKTTERLELPPTADMHVHLRQAGMMELVVPTVAKGGVDTVFVYDYPVPGWAPNEK